MYNLNSIKSTKKMVETSKQVRVDNWGVFFLSRLQVFFNKTDYCDLTLQFEGNVQLKVHRLVMNACTEYFQMLEDTSGVVDDVLMMPPELQADVILPIVNFMYTGILEFQTSIFERLYKTAQIMHITVLLQLLDAQRHHHSKGPSKPMDHQKMVNKIQQIQPQGQKRKIEPKSNLPPTLPGRKLPVWKRKHAPHNSSPTPNSTFSSKPLHRKTADPNVDNTPKPTRFEWPEDDLKNFSLLDSSFDNISYTSKPLLTQEEELRVRASTSFDSLRYLPTSNNGSKVKSGGDFGGSVDMDDLKSYVKEQKIRTDMAEFEDGDELMGEDDTIDDPDYVDPSSIKRTSRSTHSKKAKFNASEKENKEVKINLSTNQNTSPTSSKGDVDHTKIISEVLKKYPHLVKKNKNIRLKILAKTKDAKSEGVSRASKIKYQVKNAPSTKVVKEVVTTKPSSPDEGPWTCQKCLTAGEEVEFVLYYLYRKHMTDVHNEKFDSRMCKYCGHKSTKHNMLMYHQYTKHGIKPPAAYNFPKCHLCPYVALTEALMIKHKLNHTKFHLQCPQCKIAFNSEAALDYHQRITGHTLTPNPNRNQFDCQYCTKHYQSGANLFSHIRLVHRDEARRDGIVSLDEDEGEDLEEIDEESSAKKIKILSDVHLHEEKAETPQQTQQLPPNLNLVDIVVLDNNQQYIQQEFIPNLTFNTNSDITSTDELVMVLTDHDYNDGNNLTEDNSNIVVLYSHPVEGVEGVVQQQGQFITATAGAGDGGLMLNSETGMLELKDSSESIELIQREIERHGNNNAGGNIEECKAIELPQQETVINIPDSTATFHQAEEETLIHEHHHNEEHQTQSETQAAYIVQEVEQEVDESEQQNSIDVNNEHGHEEQLQAEGEQQQEQNTEDAQPMEVDEEITSTEVAVPVTETTEDVPQSEVVEIKEEDDTLLGMIENRQAVLLEDAQEDNNPQEVVMETATVEQEVVEQIQTVEEETNEVVEVKDSETSFDEKHEDVLILDENMQIIQPKAIPVIADLESVENIPVPEEKSNEDVEMKENDESVEEVKEDSGDAQENENKEEEKTQASEVIEEDNSQPADLSEEPEKTSNTIETDEPLANDEEKAMGEQKMDEATVISNQDEEVSGLTMSSTTTETDTLEAIVAEEKKMEGDMKSETAKSLLDDWEDTDSQQSEHGEKSNTSSVNTVNKLINDWDDD